MWTFFLVLYFKENNDTSIQLLEYNLKLTKKEGLLFPWGETIVKSLPMATASSHLLFLLSVVFLLLMFFAILAFLFPSSVLHQMVIQVFLFQVLHFYCDTCSVPICRECTMGRHVGHSFIYLQDALQDSRTLTIQLLADAQQGRQAIQVRYSQLKCLTFFFLSLTACLVQGRVSGKKLSDASVSFLTPSVLPDLTEVAVWLKTKCCYEFCIPAA